MPGGFYAQKINTAYKTQIEYSYNNYKSMTFANTDSAAVTISLFYVSQAGLDSTLLAGIYAAETKAVSTSSVALSVDDGANPLTIAFQNNNMLGESLYDSDGALYGEVTSVTTTQLTFSGGIKNSIANNAQFYTGTNYYLIKDLVIPSGVSFQLEPDDVNFNINAHKLYIRSSSATGSIDIITRY
jgi:hypothetical protein